MKKNLFMLAFIAVALFPNFTHAVTATVQTAPAPLSFSAVTIEPDHSVRSAGYVILVNLQAPSQDSDMTVSGTCTVNGVNVGSTLQNRTGGLYNLTYVVGVNDADRASGTIPISCTLKSPSTKDVVTATAFTDHNNTGIDPDFVTNWQAISVNSTTEKITATTATPTNVDIEYTLNGILYTTPVEGTFSTSHSITIPNLLPNTNYVYEVVATDANGLEGTSPELIPFKTGVGTSTPPPQTTPSPVDRTALNNAIIAAHNLLMSAQPGYAVNQYPQTAVYSFGITITVIQSIARQPNLTQAQVNNTLSALNNAMNVFRATQIKAAPGSFAAWVAAVIQNYCRTHQNQTSVQVQQAIGYDKLQNTMKAQSNFDQFYQQYCRAY